MQVTHNINIGNGTGNTNTVSIETKEVTQHNKIDINDIYLSVSRASALTYAIEGLLINTNINNSGEMVDKALDLLYFAKKELNELKIYIDL